MAQMFHDERKYPDNAPRKNFVFLGYPYAPALPADDYRNIMKELEDELGLRLWYFLDELTTAEMMRKIWRAILRADLAVFDISNGNPNVAFELGLAVAENRNCVTVLRTGEANPLGSADLGYAERVEYTSAATLKDRLREVLKAKSSALRLVKDLSYKLHDDSLGMSRDEVEAGLQDVLRTVFGTKKITKATARKILKSDKLADAALSNLRELDVLKIEGSKRGARYVFTDAWVTHDHEVVGS